MDALLDPLVYSPWRTSLSALRAGARGFWHASRDIFFPAHRLDSALAGGASLPPSQYDGLLTYESAEEHARRLQWRGAVLAAADALGVPALYAEHPTAVRLAFGVAVGVTVLILHVLVQQVAAAAWGALWARLYVEAADEEGEAQEGGREVQVGSALGREVPAEGERASAVQEAPSRGKLPAASGPRLEAEEVEKPPASVRRRSKRA